MFDSVNVASYLETVMYGFDLLVGDRRPLLRTQRVKLRRGAVMNGTMTESLVPYLTYPGLQGSRDALVRIAHNGFGPRCFGTIGNLAPVSIIQLSSRSYKACAR